MLCRREGSILLSLGPRSIRSHHKHTQTHDCFGGAVATLVHSDSVLINDGWGQKTIWTFTLLFIYLNYPLVKLYQSYIYFLISSRDTVER